MGRLRLNMLVARILLVLGKHPHFSHNIAEELTAGFGQLDEYGFWQFPLSNEWIDSRIKKVKKPMEETVQKMSESEHDQLVRLQERVKIFRSKLEAMVGLSIGEYRETREDVLKKFNECFAEDKKVKITTNIPIATKVKIAPNGLKLNVDSEFIEFTKSLLVKVKQEVEPQKEIFIIMLKHKIPFIVKSCEPSKAIVGKQTALEIMNFNTYTSMSLSESDLNIFMTDEKVQRILSNNIINEIMTQECAISLWKEFKSFQAKLLPELVSFVDKPTKELPK